ncbi:hypothetical protein CROQUDRAFT_671761 [Cronartium quercuum f. sp. fusiforme G11]|uniref:Nuclear speckle splicing regulatory protein 1 N-terminal domain-containing protein n=1 Tax=Cronartium quercuum f. sp. fusiforme G11 TaxID=708437 RepID=A0A9P6NG65_9BASI|nr:hypothetical protein CROQUDRAFT_671761 [Cronartium quercuum f. sp. fusiforme G11]
MSGIKFDFGNPAKSATSKAHSNPTQSPAKRITTPKVFGEDDDQDQELIPIPGRSANKLGSVRSGTGKLSRQQKQKQEEAAKLDPTVFEYDQVYDDMKQAERQSKLTKEQSGAQRKPQYISGLIETAKQRQIDRVRAEDKMVQRERESEGTQFADKDAFVTPAYLEQQAELRKAEEAEKLKAEQGPTAQGMVSFYKNILDEQARRNDAAVKAVAAKKSGGSGSLGLAATLSSVTPGPITDPQAQYDPEPESVPNEAKLAAEVGRKLGRQVDLDDEGRIVDHRQLLTGGLNMSQPKLGPKKPTKSGFALPIAERARQEKEKAEAEAALAKQHEKEEEDGLSQAEKLKLSRERQSLLLQQQLIELESNKRKAEEDKLNETIKKVARRNDESKIEELKRKAQERRKAREKLVNLPGVESESV